MNSPGLNLHFLYINNECMYNVIRLTKIMHECINMLPGDVLVSTGLCWVL